MNVLDILPLVKFVVKKYTRQKHNTTEQNIIFVVINVNKFLDIIRPMKRDAVNFVGMNLKQRKRLLNVFVVQNAKMNGKKQMLELIIYVLKEKYANVIGAEKM